MEKKIKALKEISIQKSFAISRVESSVEILDKILYSEIKDQFNAAFELMNNRDKTFIKNNNYLAILEQSTDLIQTFGFEFKDICEKSYREAISIFSSVIKLKPWHYLSICLMGICRYKIGEYEKALSDFSSVITYNDNCYTAFYFRGIVYVEMQYLVEAEVELRKAIAINNTFSSAYYGLVKVRDMNIRYEEDAAHSYMIEAIYHESNLEILKHYYLFRAYYLGYAGLPWPGLSQKGLKRNNKHIIEDISKAIEIDPLFVKAYRRRAEINLLCENYLKAIDDLSTIIELEPNNVSNYVKRASALEKANKHHRAIEDYTRAMEIDPSNKAKYIQMRAYSRIKIKEYQEAINDYTLLINLNTQFSWLYEKRAEVKEKLGDLDGALNDLNEEVRLGDNDTAALESRGMFKKRIGDYIGALDDFTLSIKSMQDNSSAFYERGLLNFELKFYEEAIRDFTKTIETAGEWDWPDFPTKYVDNIKTDYFPYSIKDGIPNRIYLYTRFFDAYYKNGLSKYYLRDFHGAIGDFSLVTFMDASYTKAYLYSGQSKQALGNYDGAFDDYSKILKIDADNPEVLRLIEVVKAKK